MIKHIVMWKILDDVTLEQITTLKKEALLLNGKIDGLIELDFIVDSLASSTHDLMLVSKHENVEALDSYQVHPLHKEFGLKIKNLVRDRVCFDSSI